MPGHGFRRQRLPGPGQNPKSRTPWRKKTPLEQRATHTLASERVLVENVIRRLKVFRVLKETYRHRRRRHGLRTHLLAGLYNHDLNVQS